MAYPEELKNLIKKVEETRPERISQARKGKHYPRMSDAEQEKVLHKFHPDYIKEAKKELKVGSNKGSVIANELVDLLESKSRVDIEDVDLDAVSGDSAGTRTVGGDLGPLRVV